MVIALIVLAVLVIVVVAVTYLRNLSKQLVAGKNNIARSFSNIDVLLKQRHDELPKLIETCRSFMQREPALDAVTAARAALMHATTPAEKAKADHTLSAALENLFAAASKQPQLKANNNFKQLQRRMNELEEKIATQRSAYNDEVNGFNLRIHRMPGNLVAKFTGLQPLTLFQAPGSVPGDINAA